MNRTAIISLLPLLLAPGIAAGSQKRDSVRNLGEVLVTGTDGSCPRNLLPYTVTVVGERELEASGEPQLLSLLSGMVPSLFVTERSVFGFGVSSSGGSGHIKLRGVGGDRASAVLMMVDGQPQFAGIYSHHVADFYGKENVERVEVLRGPGSVLYGSNAMAGAINIITRHPRRDGLDASLSTEYGSYNTWLSSLNASWRKGKLSALATAGYNRTDGTAENFDFRQAEGYLKLGYDISSSWKAYADYTLMNLHGSDPIYPRLSDPESTDIYTQSITRGEASVTLTDSYGPTSGRARIYYSYGNHFVDDPRHFHSKDDRLGITLSQNFRLWTGASGSAGFDFDRYSGEIPISGGTQHTEGSLSTMGRKSITEYSPYVTLQQSLASELLELNGGLRMANSDMFATRWVPQFGFALNPGAGVTLKGNLAMGYRNPSFRELYLYRMANPDLEPEKMMNYEVSAGWHQSRYFGIELTAYYSRGSNLIQTVDMHNENTGRFINKGIELSARSNPLPGLTLHATYSYLHTSLANLTGAPKNQYYLGADWQPVDRLRISADMRGIGGLFVSERMDGNESYVLLNLKASYDVCKYVTLFVRMENITDTRYVINYGYPMPGFTAMGGVRLRLSI
ncbi:MAG: TonB-dependent receptor [Muribaculaceae bacterium]|nr:TonB-dependent receptor [Muribaculaceae bacterium]